MCFKFFRINLNIFILSILFVGITEHAFAYDKKVLTKYIFVSSKIGDRCHSALNSFLNKNALQDEKIFFCKSSEDAVQKAEKQHGVVFLKLASIPNFHIHNDVILALREHKISKVHALVKQKAKYCLLRHKKALENKIALTSVASTPYTLQLHQNWIKSKHLTQIEVPAGSSEAARLLSDEILSLSTAVIASDHASTVYEELKVVKSDFASTVSYDIFALIETKKRATAKNVSDVKQEISQIFNKQTALKNPNGHVSDPVVLLEDL